MDERGDGREVDCKDPNFPKDVLRFSTCREPPWLAGNGANETEGVRNWVKVALAGGAAPVLGVSQERLLPSGPGAAIGSISSDSLRGPSGDTRVQKLVSEGALLFRVFSMLEVGGLGSTFSLELGGLISVGPSSQDWRCDTSASSNSPGSSAMVSAMLTFRKAILQG